MWRLPFEVRNWLKEAQSVRNRWAHLPPAGLPPNDVYRDADTIFRLMSGLGVGEDCFVLADEVRTRAAAQLPLPTPLNGKQVLSISSRDLSISKGDIVRLKVRSECTGAIVGILDGAGEVRYQVFHDGKIATYYESPIELVEPEIVTPHVDVATLHAALTSLQLCHPSTSSLYSLFASRIHFVCLMVYRMETWFLVDRDSLRCFPHDCCRDNALPQWPDLAAAEKSRVFEALAMATAACGKKRDTKGRISFELHKPLDPTGGGGLVCRQAGGWRAGFLPSIPGDRADPRKFDPQRT